MNGYILQAISSNAMAIVLLIIVVLNYRHKHHEKRQEYKCFIAMMCLNIFQCVVETITVVIDGQRFAGDVWIARVLNSMLFAGSVCFAMMWSMFADSRVARANGHQNKTWNAVKHLPAIIIVVASVVNVFTPIFFRITEENVYQRTWLFFVAFAFTYFYLILGTVTIYTHRKKTDNYNFMPVFTFLAPVFLASILQTLLPGISLLWAGSAVGIASAYMSLLDESASMDKLSGLFSRHYLNQYLSSLPGEAHADFSVLGILLDVDDFKSINDTYGHLAGDEAITAIGDILRKAIPTQRMLFRYAGDEFVVIMPIRNEAEIENIVAKIHNITEFYNLNEQKPYKIKFSVGYTLHVPGESPTAFIERMDEAMYKVKRSKQIVD